MSVTAASFGAGQDRKSAAAMAPVVFAGSIGTIIEWYDFLIYGTAAALVFNSQFFPTVDPLTGTLASLATYAVGFFARPIGAALFGHYGDRFGRKAMLMVTMAVMALGTFAVGLLPGYSQIGIWAPILLVTLRIIQGIGLGGEWGGASLIVLEHAPPERRGLYGSLVQIGFPLGMVASAGVFALVTMLPEASFRAWGWRVPFLLSIILLAVGYFVRRRVPETPLFENIKATGAIAKSPLLETIFKNPRSFLVAVGLKISEVSWVYALTVFAVIYTTRTLGMPKKLMLDAIFIGALIEVPMFPVFGWISDKYGRRLLYFLGTAFTAAFAFPLFWLLGTKDPTIVTAAVAVALIFGHGPMFSLQSTYFPELFGTRVRYTGASLGFQLAAAIGGGLTPILATSLASAMGGTAGVSIMLIGLAMVTLVATLFARETRGESLHEEGSAKHGG